ncbi:hypothetical protein ACP_2318 [Acidobacterium capsulatum ATCC 51196]|uniref:Uncharacterized protein n=1 Tax=Acidobacterium capsulatum (strain ATCC 51196 / DSM 11244 / BCRC 80197 / JCM 7670 / NBRC 15755 / NCIMB 13165 / 161) TaxID=240015 RepID=C1FAC0_ACIC5|nr:hypothetical protein ACP_2318 [Acidobacterium capsulatum ATCC 51196]
MSPFVLDRTPAEDEENGLPWQPKAEAGTPP